MHVINYDFSNVNHDEIQKYVYRIKRTAQIENVKFAILFYNKKNKNIATALIRI